MKNAYEILGLNHSASEEDIKKAYKKLALQYHPDKCNDVGANEKFLEIQKAYEELTSESANEHTQEIEKIYAKNIFYECKITLRDVYLQNIKKFNIKRSCICKDCHLICNHCGGFGFIKDHLKFGPFIQVLQQNCFKCSTNGVILNLKNDCNKCVKGDIIEEQLINLKINSSNLKQIVINNWGSQPTRKNELPGDLIISFYVLEDPNFKRINNDLIFNCNITLKESIIGKVLTIPHYSENITIDISNFGIINPKKQYTINNKGFSQTGHLHIKFNIVYPDKILNEKEKYSIKDALSCI